MSSLRERWDAEAANWLAADRGRRRETDHHPDFNFPFFLRVLPPAAGPTLELGSGEGRVLQALRAGGYDAEGVDASPTMIAAARRANPRGRCTFADAASLPFDDATFALVVAFMSLHDMDDLEQVVAEASRVLQPDGHFCFAVPHPLQTAGTWENGSFCISHSYFERRQYVVTDVHEGLRVNMWSEHRSLESYLNALEANGLAIQSLREPQPFADVSSTDETAGSEKWRRILPFAVHVRAAKLSHPD